MLKVLVADEDLVANKTCCQYLSVDKNLNVISASTGISVLNKYHEIKPNILVINSDFHDKNYVEIINELSNTQAERNKCNIILSLDKEMYVDNKVELNIMAKVYMKFDNLDYDKIKNGIEMYSLDHFIFYEPSDENLKVLFFKLKIYNESIGAEYFRFAIKECYKNPSLQNSLNTIFELIAMNYGVSVGSVRPAMRKALEQINNNHTLNKDIGFMKLFNDIDFITPRKFIRTISEYYINQKK